MIGRLFDGSPTRVNFGSGVVIVNHDNSKFIAFGNWLILENVCCVQVSLDKGLREDVILPIEMVTRVKVNIGERNAIPQLFDGRRRRR